MRRFFTRMTMVVFSIIVLQFVPKNILAQSDSIKQPFKGYLYFQPNIGISQYFGSFNKKDFWNQNPKLAYGAVLGYQLSPVFGLRSQVMKTDLYSKRSDKNQELTSDLWDVALHLTININDIFAKYNEKRFLNFYLFGGVGYTFFNTTIQDITTNTIIDESTGQTEFIMPLGAGAKFRLSYNFSLNLEYGDRTVFKGTKFDFYDPGEDYRVHYSYASAGL